MTTNNGLSVPSENIISQCHDVSVFSDLKFITFYRNYIHRSDTIYLVSNCIYFDCSNKNAYRIRATSKTPKSTIVFFIFK